MNPKTVLHLVANVLQHVVVEFPVRLNQVGGKRRLRGAHPPNVQVVDGCDSRTRFQPTSDRPNIDPRRHGLQSQVHCVAEQIPRAVNNCDGDYQAREQINPKSSGQNDGVEVQGVKGWMRLGGRSQGEWAAQNCQWSLAPRTETGPRSRLKAGWFTNW